MGNGNPFREFYDELARSSDLVEASHRPAGTTDRMMRLLLGDVLEKLDLRPGDTVAEIGCGVGVLGIPIAQRSHPYTGIDISPRAIEVFRDRAVGLPVKLYVMDVLGASNDEIRALGTFDRVLLYFTLNVARSEEEGFRFAEVAGTLLRPGGRALIGSLPMAELRPRAAGTKAISLVRWLATPTPNLPHTRAWKARSLAYRSIRRVTDARQHTAATPVPSVATLETDQKMVEGWLERLGLRGTWRPMRIGVPVHAIRADLIVQKPDLP